MNRRTARDRLLVEARRPPPDTFALDGIRGHGLTGTPPTAPAGDP